MKIKIVSTRHTVSWGDGEEITYDVYHGFSSVPPLPFFTKWILDKSGLTEDELMQYMRPLLTIRGSVKIITELSIPY